MPPMLVLRTISGKILFRSACRRLEYSLTTFEILNRKKVRYWRDVGTLDAYYEANMDLVAVEPEFNLYDRDWPLRTRVDNSRRPSSCWRKSTAAWRSCGLHRLGWMHYFRAMGQMTRKDDGHHRSSLYTGTTSGKFAGLPRSLISSTLPNSRSVLVVVLCAARWRPELQLAAGESSAPWAQNGELQPVHGFAAETTAAVIIQAAVLTAFRFLRRMSFPPRLWASNV